MWLSRVLLARGEGELNRVLSELASILLSHRLLGHPQISTQSSRIVHVEEQAKDHGSWEYFLFPKVSVTVSSREFGRIALFY
jgi:hypothetical protein